MASTRRAVLHAMRHGLYRAQAIAPPRIAVPAWRQGASIPRLSPAYQAIRWHSAPATSPKAYEYNDIKQISFSPSPNRILIDVREPHEFADGYIPTAINIPIKSQPDALLLPDEEFEDRFGFSKPARAHEVVFYCKAGVRSSAAAQLARQNGYSNVGEYRGSWLDWQKNGGVEAKP